MLNTKIGVLNSQIDATLNNLVSGAKKIVELDEEIGSEWNLRLNI
ncbi:MAG: hypothetical protein ACK5HR_03110 [Mycoplasmatales bacterium]